MTRSNRARATTVTTASTANIPSRTSFPPTPPSLSENSSESRTTAAKSATDAPAMVNCPTGWSTWPASFSTGTTSPKEVADRATAMSRGDFTHPTAPNASPTATPRSRVSPNPAPAVLRIGPRSLATSISRPARKRRNASPIRASTSTGTSTSTHPSPAGPTTMPATISSTTAGTRSDGTSPRRRGAATAMAATTAGCRTRASRVDVIDRHRAQLPHG